MKKKILLAASVVFLSLLGLKASAYNPTFTITNKSACVAIVVIQVGGCPSTNNTGPYIINPGSSIGPFDATMVTWNTIPAPNPATVVWNEFMVNMPSCPTSTNVGSGVCPSGFPVYSGTLCVTCSAAIPLTMTYATVSYTGAGDATVLIQ